MAIARHGSLTMPAIKQSDLFLQGEGDAWHERNKDKSRLPDPILEAMKACKLQPSAVLELGCGTGWRLREIGQIWVDVDILRGYDASQKAIEIGTDDFSDLIRMDIRTALTTEGTKKFDTIIFGFCLYVIDREDLMSIAAHTDRVLQDGGHIIIQDFLVDKPYKVAYKH